MFSQPESLHLNREPYDFRPIGSTGQRTTHDEIQLSLTDAKRAMRNEYLLESLELGAEANEDFDPPLFYLSEFCNDFELQILSMELMSTMGLSDVDSSH